MGPRGTRLQSSSRIPGPGRRRVRSLILVGPVVVLPAALLLSSAAGHRTAGDGYRGKATAAVVLVLLSQRQSLLSDRSHVPRGVDQGPAPSSCGSIIRESIHAGPPTRALGEPDRGDDGGLC